MPVSFRRSSGGVRSGCWRSRSLSMTPEFAVIRHVASKLGVGADAGLHVDAQARSVRCPWAELESAQPLGPHLI